jgi:hypothetical protein
VGGPGDDAKRMRAKRRVWAVGKRLGQADELPGNDTVDGGDSRQRVLTVGAVGGGGRDAGCGGGWGLLGLACSDAQVGSRPSSQTRDSAAPEGTRSTMGRCRPPRGLLGQEKIRF